MRRNLRLTVEVKTGGGNFSDDPPEEWKTYSNDAFLGVEWFGVTPLSSREYIQAQQVQSSISHQGECAWFPGANSEMRLKEASTGRIFNVASVVNRDERNRTLDWMLTEAI